MSEALSQYRVGSEIFLLCYHHDCEDIHPAPAILKRPSYLGPHFSGSERFHWKNATPTKSFYLKEDVQCKGCESRFTKAIIVSRGRGRKPLIFGYESEGC